MPYNSSTGLVTAPVTIADAYAAFGAPIPEDGMMLPHILGRYIKNNPSKIRMFARFKPVCHTDIFASNPGKNNDWWKAKYKGHSIGRNGDCGIYIPVPSSDENSWQHCADEGQRAQYIPPEGGMDAAFRLADMAGYSSKATCPFELSMPKSFVLSNKTDANAYLQASLNLHSRFGEDVAFDTRYNLTLADIFPDQDAELLTNGRFFTLAVWNKTKNKVVFLQHRRKLDANTGDELRIRLPLVKDNNAAILENLNAYYSSGDKIEIYAMFAGELANAVNINDDIRRSTYAPSNWRSLYFETKPKVELTAVWKETVTQVTMTGSFVDNNSVVVIDENGRGTIQVYRFMAGFKVSPSEGTPHIPVSVRLRVVSAVDPTDFICEDMDITPSNGMVVDADSSGAQREFNRTFPTCKFNDDTSSIYNGNYGGDKHEFNVEVSFHSGGYNISGKITGKLKLTKTGNNYTWTFTKS